MTCHDAQGMTPMLPEMPEADEEESPGAAFSPARH